MSERYNYYDTTWNSADYNLVDTTQIDLRASEGVSIKINDVSNSEVGNGGPYYKNLISHFRFREDPLNGNTNEIKNYLPRSEKLLIGGTITDTGLDHNPSHGSGNEDIEFEGYETLTPNVDYYDKNLIKLHSLNYDFIKTDISNNGLNFSFWIKIKSDPPDTSGTFKSLLFPLTCGGWNGSSYDSGTAFIVEITNANSKDTWNRIYFFWFDTSTGDYQYVYMDITFSLDTWYYIDCFLTTNGYGYLYVNDQHVWGGAGGILPSELVFNVDDTPICVGGYNHHKSTESKSVCFDFGIRDLYFGSAYSTTKTEFFYNNGNGRDVINRFADEGWIKNNTFINVKDIIDFDSKINLDPDALQDGTDASAKTKYFIEQNQGGSIYVYYYNEITGHWVSGSETNANDYNTFKNNLSKLKNDLDLSYPINIGVYMHSGDRASSSISSQFYSPFIEWLYFEYLDAEGEKRVYFKFRASYKEYKEIYFKYNIKPFEDIKNILFKFNVLWNEGLKKNTYRYVVLCIGLKNILMKFNVKPFFDIKKIYYKFAVKQNEIKESNLKFLVRLNEKINKVLKFNVEPFENEKEVIFKFRVFSKKIKNVSIKFIANIYEKIEKVIKYNVKSYEGEEKKFIKFNIKPFEEEKIKGFKFKVIYEEIKNVMYKFFVLENERIYKTFKFKEVIYNLINKGIKFKVKPYEGDKRIGFKYLLWANIKKKISFKFSKIGVGKPKYNIRYRIVQFANPIKSLKFKVVFKRFLNIRFKVRRAYKYIDRLRYDNQLFNEWFEEDKK